MRRLRLAAGSQHPLRKIRDREPAHMRGSISQTKTAQLHRIVSLVSSGYKNNQFLLDGVAVVLEHGVALAMPGAICVPLANRKRRGSPHRAGLLIAQINNLGLRIGDWVVMPWRQTIRLAISPPGPAQAAFA